MRTLRTNAKKKKFDYKVIILLKIEGGASNRFHLKGLLRRLV